MVHHRAVYGDRDSNDAVLAMIASVRVNGVPGKIFHASPEGVRTIRFQFAVTPPVLDEVCQRFEKG